MSDFDELSRREWEQRKSRRKDIMDSLDPDSPAGPDTPDRTGRPGRRESGRLSLDDDIDQAERRTPLNPGWRKGRTARSRGRRSAGAVYASPQEFQLWLQKGGWLWIAASAVLVVGALIFVLAQSRSARSDSNPFAGDDNPSAVESDSASGTGNDADMAEGSEASGDASDISSLPQQPTVTPEPPPPPPESLPVFEVYNTGGQGLFLRNEPGGNVIATLPDGSRVEQVDEEEEQVGTDYVWRKIRAPDGQEGWVAVDFLRPAP